MTYFVKYLPVEGHFHYIGAFIRSNKSGNVAKIKRVGEDLNETEWEHVKPFLCSTDIKTTDVGITYYSPHDFNDQLVASSDTHWTIEDYKYYKAVAEISPAALTFVKEGDIVDEDGVQLCYWPGGSGSETWNVIPWERMGSLAQGDRHKLYTMAKIKCGQCQHFH